MEERNKFEYKYTAPTEEERRVAESLRREYLAEEKEESGVSRLRNLDRKVKTPPTILGWGLGVGGTLLFGVGLTMILEWDLTAWGAFVALLGCVPVALAYPLHKRWLQARKKKYRAEILRLSEKLLAQEK